VFLKELGASLIDYETKYPKENPDNDRLIYPEDLTFDEDDYCL